MSDMLRRMAVAANSKAQDKRKEKPRRDIASKLTPQQALLGMHLRELGLAIEYEYRFLPERKFRFDVFIPRHLRGCGSNGIGIECDGGMWRGHRRGAAIEADNEKVNLAQANGFMCLRFTNRQIERGEAKDFIRKHVLGDSKP